MILETLDGPHTEPSGLRGPEATKRADLRHPQEEFEGPFGGIEKAESGVEVVPGDSPGFGPPAPAGTRRHPARDSASFNGRSPYLISLRPSRPASPCLTDPARALGQGQPQRNHLAVRPDEVRRRRAAAHQRELLPGENGPPVAGALLSRPTCLGYRKPTSTSCRAAKAARSRRQREQQHPLPWLKAFFRDSHWSLLPARATVTGIRPLGVASAARHRP